ncbi:unnamed protein product [Gongylonema pulchrum]|uniref:Uncharacterized protein n=1 Tax=Gongylonema pulchrum TaxID=637853 RepID=A0A183EL32_9BILA|nr:unnamed protein product [Gongylonema pulchrum]
MPGRVSESTDQSFQHHQSRHSTESNQFGGCKFSAGAVLCSNGNGIVGDPVYRCGGQNCYQELSRHGST